MYFDEIVLIVLIIIIIIILGYNTLFAKSLIGTVAKKAGVYATPIIAEEVARRLANPLLEALSRYGLLPPNTTAASIF